MKYILILSLLIFISCTPKINVPEPLKESVKSSELENTKINEGISLHDKGFYKKAIKLYQEALQINPDNVLAMYEIAYSYSLTGDHENSLKYSLKGLEYKSEYLGILYMTAGNSLDILGQSENAIKVYTKAISFNPNEHMFYYNLGITYYQMSNFEKAEENFIESLKRNHNHPSSNMALAEIYINKGQQIPAILLLCKFLINEPKSQRSIQAHEKLTNVLSAGVTKESEKNISVNIFALADPNKTQFSTIEMFFKLSRATRYTEENKDKSEIELRLSELSSLMAFMKKEDLKSQDKFIEKYLITYFSDLSKNEFNTVFTYYIHQIYNKTSIQEWLKKNWPKVDEFEKWNTGYELNINS